MASKNEKESNVIQLNRQRLAKSRKRGKTLDEVSNLSVGKQSRQDRSRSKSSNFDLVGQNKRSKVKRKIDFSTETTKSKQVKQSNNNATIAPCKQMIVLQQDGVKTRGKRLKEDELSVHDSKRHNCSKTNADGLSKVQWTKEFMSKVRKSNERNLNKKNETRNMNETINMNVHTQLQELEDNTKGDGVVMHVKGGYLADDLPGEELLDYDDDLSVEEDGGIEVAEEEKGSDNCTDKNKEGDMQQLIETQSEEMLMKNPVMQRVMENFFQSRFKEMMNDPQIPSTSHPAKEMAMIQVRYKFVLKNTGGVVSVSSLKMSIKTGL